MKIKMNKILVFILFLGCLYQCKSIKQTKVSEVKPMELYLLIGQSNMAGRATIELQDQDTLNNVFLFTGNEETAWEKAANPLNKYSTIRKNLKMQKLGPGYSFAKEISEQHPHQKIGLIVNAKGGSSLEEWMAGGLFYKEMISRTQKAMEHGVLKGVLWHQGESNSSRYKTYLPKISLLITSLRKDLGQPDLPFVAGQLSTDKKQRNNFNQMILELPKNVEFTAVVTSENTATIDKTHFDSKSQRLLGKRYAVEMMKLTSKK